MKQIMSGGGGGLRIPTEDEVEVVEILLSLPKILAESELKRRYGFTWGATKKRSTLVSKSESSPSPSTLRGIVESSTDEVTAMEDDKSPSTPLCFLPCGSGSDGAIKRNLPSSVKKNLKRKATDDLVESYNTMQQERETLLRETKAMKTLHQKLTSTNLELKSIIQKVNYSRNIEDFQLWNNSMKIIDHQSYHPQITMFVPPTPQQQHQHCQLMAVSCSGNSHGGGRFGLFNQIDPRVKIHGETYDFMASSQPSDQSKYLVMDNHLRVRTAAAARKRRILRMKENKNALLALKLRGSR